MAAADPTFNAAAAAMPSAPKAATAATAPATFKPLKETRRQISPIARTCGNKNPKKEIKIN